MIAMSSYFRRSLMNHLKIAAERRGSEAEGSPWKFASQLAI
jgi:hypothetical protein